MSFTILWSVSGDTGPGGQPWNGSVTVEGIQRISATVAVGDEEEFEILADSLTRLRLLCIASSHYENVTIGMEASAMYPFTEPLMATGPAIQFTQGSGPSRVFVRNESAVEITIDILVCREANA